MLFGCETWFLTYIKGAGRLRVFENSIQKQIFGPKRDEDGDLKRFHNEELLSLYCSPNKVRVINSRRSRWAGHMAKMEEDKECYQNFNR